MTATKTLRLCEQRRAIRQQMQQQREKIAHALTNSSDINHYYPRSKTMRFLMQYIDVKTLVELAALIIGARVFKSVSTSLAVVNFIQSVQRNSM